MSNLEKLKTLLAKIEEIVGFFSTYQTTIGHAQDIPYIHKPAQQFLWELGVENDRDATLSTTRNRTALSLEGNKDVVVNSFDVSNPKDNSELVITGARIDRLLNSAKTLVNVDIIPHDLYRKLLNVSRCHLIKTDKDMSEEDLKKLANGEQLYVFIDFGSSPNSSFKLYYVGSNDEPIKLLINVTEEDWAKIAESENKEGVTTRNNVLDGFRRIFSSANDSLQEVPNDTHRLLKLIEFLRKYFECIVPHQTELSRVQKAGEIFWENLAVGVCHAQEIDFLTASQINANGEAITAPKTGIINENDPALLLLSTPALNFRYGSPMSSVAPQVSVELTEGQQQEGYYLVRIEHRGPAMDLTEEQQQSFVEGMF